MKRTSIRRLWIGVALGIGLLVLLSAGLAAQAAPACPDPFEVRQADGLAITIVNCGDEFFNWQEDVAGNVVAFDEGSANWCYAAIAGEEIVPGPEAIGMARPAGVAYAPVRKINRIDIAPLLQNVNRSAGIDASGSAGYGESGMPVVTHEKNRQPLLVLLIEYNNRQFSTFYSTAVGKDTTGYWSNHFFGNSGKTVNTYFAEVSGPFNLQFTQPNFTVANGTTITSGLPSGVSSVLIKDGVALVRLNRNHPDSRDSKVIRADVDLAFNAVKGKINFSGVAKTVNPGPGGAVVNGYSYLCQDFNISTVFAGFEASGSSGGTPEVWAHANYYRNTFSIGGVAKQRTIAINASNMAMQSYTAQGELYNAATSMSLGVSCHELGHILGLPDLYSYIGGVDIGSYSVMAYGSWGTDQLMGSTDTKAGNTPTHLDAWSKIRLGFVTPVQVTPTTYWRNNLNSAAGSSYNTLKIAPASGTQYFLVENRQLVGYDRGLWRAGVTTGGILIWHIDEAAFDAKNDGDTNANGNNFHRGADLENYQKTFIGTATTGSPFYVQGGRFDAGTTPNSNFHQAGHDTNLAYHFDCHPQTIASGVQIRVNSPYGSVMNVETGPFVAVTGITNVPTGTPMGVQLALTGTVNPSNASNQAITWSVVSAGTTGATIIGGNTLNPPNIGTVTIRATIVDGLAVGTNYTQDFVVTVAAPDFTLNQSGTYAFPAAVFGYPLPASLSVQVNNVGAVPTGPISIAISDAGSFTLSAASLPSIGVSAGSTFSVVPKTGLVQGTTYTATVTVSGVGVTRSFNVSFTVNVSPNKDIIAVSSPAFISSSGTTITANVDSGTASLTVALTVSPGATWKLYSDAARTNEITSKGMNLAVGANTAYIRVTAQDGSTKDYTLTITRAQPKGIFGTKPQYNQWYHYLMFFFLFGFIWMWF